VDLTEDWRSLRAKNVRNSANQALRRQTFELIEKPVEYAATFWDLYQHTIERHAIYGIQRLSLEAITTQLDVEGVVMVVARKADVIRGIIVSYDQGEEAHLHLVAQSPEGYATKSSYGLIHYTLEALQNRGCVYANIGGPAGISDDPEDGLYRFKSRWTRHRGATLLCGQVLHRTAYDSLVARSGCQSGTFFPAYRTPRGRFEWRPTIARTIREAPTRD
jgi:lipid II:glycine glycyltransferase (peptidoglycan interpeptide bridge formation enzyme)